MPNFMTQYTCKLVFVFELVIESFSDENLTTGKRKGVDGTAVCQQMEFKVVRILDWLLTTVKHLLKTGHQSPADLVHMSQRASIV